METLAVVVPVLNERHMLDAQCANFNRLKELSDELIFVDGGSMDGTPKWFSEKNFNVVSSEKGRALQMNAGANGVSSTLILFLHVDSQIPDDFSLSEVLSTKDFIWGAFHVELYGKHNLLPWVAKGINFRSQLFGVFTGDQGLLVRRSFFYEIGQFKPIPLMEDIEFSRRAKKFYQGKFCSQFISSSGRYWDKHGLVRSVFKMWYLQFLFKLGVAPEFLHRRYYLETKTAKNEEH